MATLSLPALGSQPAIVWREIDGHAQGEEGKSLRARAQEAFAHWSAPSALVRPDSETTYRSVPLKPVRFVKTRYQRIGRRRPLPYQLDE